MFTIDIQKQELKWFSKGIELSGLAHLIFTLEKNKNKKDLKRAKKIFKKALKEAEAHFESDIKIEPSLMFQTELENA